ncbi:MAG TPA: hypothetical protein VJ801_05320 [Polyangia bacterium]|jgi:hypothetical protein|nr:hypothetical protein [Polyangia bacterium]
MRADGMKGTAVMTMAVAGGTTKGAAITTSTKGASENICNDLDDDPSRLASLLVVAIRRVFLLLAPRQPGASPPNS